MGGRRGPGVGLAIAGAAMAGCGGGASKSDGAAGSGAAGAGAAGAGGAGGSGAAGSAGVTGTGGGAAGSGGGLPACAITTQPNDPVNTEADSGAIIAPPSCNTIMFAGDWVVPVVFSSSDAGVQFDGGPVEAPAGGVILDGDYDLVGLQLPAGPGQTTRRTIRVFGGGSFIEWAVALQNPSADGGVQELWYNSTTAPNGSALGAEFVCGVVGGVDAYTAAGDTLTFFVYLHSLDESPIGIDTYRRTCAR